MVTQTLSFVCLLYCYLLISVGLDVEQTFTPQYSISSMPAPRPPANVSAAIRYYYRHFIMIQAGVSSSAQNMITDTSTTTSSSSKGTSYTHVTIIQHCIVGKASSSSGKTRYRPCSHRCINKTMYPLIHSQLSMCLFNIVRCLTVPVLAVVMSAVSMGSDCLQHHHHHHQHRNPKQHLR